MNIVDHLPPGLVPRKDQTDILAAVQEYEKSYDRIIICAPTGIGKSAIAYALADYYGDSFILTSTKNLQDQYRGSFPELPAIKGKNNFVCEYLVERNGGLLQTDDTVRYCRDRRLSADHGPCTGRTGNVDDVCRKRRDGGCSYYSQRDAGLKAAVAVANYALYFRLKNMHRPPDGSERRCCVYDEAHDLESQLLRYSAGGIGGAELKSVGLEYCRHEIRDIEDIRKIYDAARDRCTSLMPEADAEEAVSLGKKYDRWNRMCAELREDPDNFVHEEKWDGGLLVRIQLQPLQIAKYAKKFLDAGRQFFLSGTIDRQNFCAALGLDTESTLLLEVERSPFRLRNRRVEYRNVAEMSAKSGRDDHAAIHAAVREIAERHRDERGLVLTNSKSAAADIMESAPPATRARMTEGHSENADGTDAAEALKKHGESGDSILVSSSMWEGIDLRGDLGRFCIITKCPYPYLGDPRIKKLAENSWDWYGYRTVTRILQGMGRCVRSADDSAITYVLDSKVQKLLRRSKHMVPAAYRDAVYGGLS